jgi:hypothetical protein
LIPGMPIRVPVIELGGCADWSKSFWTTRIPLSSSPWTPLLTSRILLSGSVAPRVTRTGIRYLGPFSLHSQCSFLGPFSLHSQTSSLGPFSLHSQCSFLGPFSLHSRHSSNA